MTNEIYQHYIAPVILGLVEGLTEFLPISSTGHLIIAERLLGFEGGASQSFTVFIQLGAIFAVLILYWARFFNLCNLQARGGLDGIEGIKKIALTTLPALVLGAAFSGAIKQYLFNPTTVAAGLIAGAFLLLLAEQSRKKANAVVHDVARISLRQSFLIGCFQCLALWPGMSRSGSTIGGAMLLGLDRKAATEFSFLAAVPVMCAAVGYDLLKNLSALHMDDVVPFAVGFVTAFVSAVIAVKFLLRFVAHYSLMSFVWYRIALGILILCVMS